MSLGGPRPSAFRRVLADLERELRRTPRAARLHALKGKVLSALSHYPQARQALRRSLALDGGCALSRAWLGEAFLLENLVAKAIPELERALELDPGCAWASFYRAAARYIMGRGKQVEEDLRGLLKAGVDPAVQAAAGAFSGLLEAKAGRYDAALARINEVRARCPGQSWPLVLRAAVHRASGDRTAALEDLGSALAAGASAWLHLERAAVHEELGQLAEALANVESAKKLDGATQEILLRRGRLQAGLKRYSLALRDFGRAARFGPSDGLRAFGIQLLAALKETSRADDARRLVEVLARLFPDDRETRSSRTQTDDRRNAESSVVKRRRAAVIMAEQKRHQAVVLIQQGRRKEAEAVLRAAARGGAADSSVFNELGQLLERRGRRAEAEAAYRRAVALKPGRLHPYFRLAQLLLNRGDRREMARVLNDAALAASPAADADVNGLIDRFQLALCRCDNEEAARMGEAVLDRTRRLKDLESLSVPILPGFDGIQLAPAFRNYSMKAMRAAQKYAAARPRSPWGDYIQIQWQVQMDPSPEAQARCYRRLTAFPASRYGWMRFTIGRDLLYRGKFRSAIKHLEVARDFSSPPDWRSQCYIAEAHVFQGDMAGALRAFRKAEELAADARGEATAWKGAALLWAGRYRLALRVLDGIPQEAQSPYALCWKGAALSKLRRFRPALTALDEVLARFPDDFEARVWRAETLLRAGRAREALRDADAVCAREGERNHYATAVRGLARAALGDDAGMQSDLRLMPTPLIRIALRRLGLAEARKRDTEKILENILESSRGLRRTDVDLHMAHWLS